MFMIILLNKILPYQIIMKIHFKKKWMTLIELLMVIAILWILINISIPYFFGTREKARDISRRTQVQEIASALISYKVKNWEFPRSTWSCISDLKEKLVDWWYLSNIAPDPNGEKIFTYCNTAWNQACPDPAYNYVSNGERFVIVAYMENESNWNYICTNSTKCTQNIDETHLCEDLAELWSWMDLNNFIWINKYSEWYNSHIYAYIFNQ